MGITSWDIEDIGDILGYPQDIANVSWDICFSDSVIECSLLSSTAVASYGTDTSTHTLPPVSFIGFSQQSQMLALFVFRRASRPWPVLSVSPSRFRGLPQDMAVPSRFRRRESLRKIKFKN